MTSRVSLNIYKVKIELIKINCNTKMYSRKLALLAALSNAFYSVQAESLKTESNLEVY